MFSPRRRGFPSVSGKRFASGQLRGKPVTRTLPLDCRPYLNPRSGRPEAQPENGDQYPLNLDMTVQENLLNARSMAACSKPFQGPCSTPLISLWKRRASIHAFRLIRLIEQDDGMRDPKVHAPLAGAERDLNLATGVARADHGRFGVFHVPHFPVEKLHRYLSLREIVAACRAATPLTFLEGRNIEVPNRCENIERLPADLERVIQGHGWW